MCSLVALRCVKMVVGCCSLFVVVIRCCCLFLVALYVFFVDCRLVFVVCCSGFVIRVS